MESRTSHSLIELDQLERLFETHLAQPPEQRDLKKLLEGVIGPTRSMFIEELVAMDVELREQDGDSPKEADYLVFVEDENEIVRQVFQRFASRSTSQVDQLLHDNRPQLPERYEQLEQIGSGGVGEVWRVFDRHLQRPLALKILRDKYRNSRQANMRMEREAMLTGLLQHPGIPAVHDSGILSDGSHFFSMKLVAGRTLAEISDGRDGEVNSLPEDLVIFETVAQAMSFAHSQGIIHRDLKPQNVMVGQFGEVQVMDWGMARRIEEQPIPENSTRLQAPNTVARAETVSRGGDSSIESRPSLTMVGDVIGTPRYMAPEQARGELDRLDARTDVYALGAILFKILTSTRIHGNETTANILARVASGDLTKSLEPLSHSEADSTLVDLCRRCLASEMIDRPSDAGEVSDSITSYLVSAQHRARTAALELRESEVRVQEQQKRRRTFNRMLAVVAVAVGLGMAGILWQWNAAKESSARTVGVLDIVTGSFRSIMPTVGGTSDMSAKQVLLNAKKKLEDSDLDEEGELILLENLTSCFLDLGEYANARETADAALVLCDQQYSDDHPTTLRMSHLLGQTMMRENKLDGAIELLTDVCERFRDTQGLNHEDTLAAELTLAGCYFRNEETDEALNRYQDIRNRFAINFGEDSRQHLTVVSNIVGVYHSLEKHEEAISLGENYLPLMQESLGEDHPQVMGMTSNLAAIHFAIDDVEKAAELWAKTKDMMEVPLGVDHPNRLSVISNLSIALMSLDRSDEAIVSLQEVIPLMEAKFGVDHPGVLRSRIALGTAKSNIGQFEEAAEVFKVALEKFERTMGSDNPLTELVRERYTNALLASGQFGESAKKFTDIYEEKKEKLGAEHPDTIAELNMVVWTYAISNLNEGRVSKALLEEFRRGCKISNDPDHLNTLAVAEYRCGDYEASIATVERAILTKKEQSKSLANAAMSFFSSSGKSELHPSNFGLLAMCYLQLGENEKAKAEELKFQAALETANKDVKRECEFFVQQLKQAKDNAQ